MSGCRFLDLKLMNLSKLIQGYMPTIRLISSSIMLPKKSLILIWNFCYMMLLDKSHAFMIQQLEIL